MEPSPTSRPLLAGVLHTQDRHDFIARAIKHDIVAVNDHLARTTHPAGTVQRWALPQAFYLGAELLHQINGRIGIVVANVVE